MANGRKEAEPGAGRWWKIVLLLGFSLFTALSLLSYEWGDIGLLKAPPDSPPSNAFGPVGAWLSFVLLMGIGLAAYAIPVALLILGLVFILRRDRPMGSVIVWGVMGSLALAFLLELHASTCHSLCAQLNIPDAGGIFSRLLMRGVLIRWLSPVGAGILVWTLFLFSLLVLIGTRNVLSALQATARATRTLINRLRERSDRRRELLDQIEKEERKNDRRRRHLEESIERTVEMPAPASPFVASSTTRTVAVEASAPAVDGGTSEAGPSEADPAPAPAPKPVRPAPTKPLDGERMPTGSMALPSSYQVPPLSLLAASLGPADRGIQTDTSTTAKILVETLAEFGIESEVTNVERGPVVTRYELLPAPGVRVEKISGLSNNLALSLKATSVRVQAPIPGKGVVGIEVPNTIANMVYLREVLEGEMWQSGKAKLPLALGKDVGGKDLVIDLAEMPHLLIAGATGSGKTVCMNSILAGLLMSRSPDQLRLLLVDPKIVEFAAYNHLPHLVVPVITDASKVTLGLRWAINEMEKRYKLFAKAGVRNIDGYNHRVIAKQKDLFDGGSAESESENEPPDRIPYIVIVIDELADLMLVAQADIENCIARLAQLSRAVGIHMILSTQRPSVNVITGTIKANFPARIAFQVAQKVDSRTILDTVGAEKLLGRGDMLVLPPGASKMIRAQGAWTTDAEVHGISDFIRRQAEPSYEVEIKDRLEKPTSKIDEGSEDEDLINQAAEIIRETHRASTSSLQRRLRIGYTRAARIMDILEERGIVGPPRGSDPREILIDLDGGIPDNADDQDPGTE